MAEVLPAQSDPAKAKNKRGRPRLNQSEKSQAERRRAQIRDAQKTYRLKKESAIQNLEKRVVLLQNAINSFEIMYRQLYMTGMELAVKANNRDFFQLFGRSGAIFEKILLMFSENGDFAKSKGSSLTVIKINKHLNDGISGFVSPHASKYSDEEYLCNSMSLESTQSPYNANDKTNTFCDNYDDTKTFSSPIINSPYTDSNIHFCPPLQPFKNYNEDSKFGNVRSTSNCPSITIIGTEPPMLLENTLHSSVPLTLSSPEQFDKNMEIVSPPEMAYKKHEFFFTDFKDLFSIARDDLQSAALNFLRTYDPVLSLPIELRNSLPEIIFRNCLFRVIELYVSGRFDAIKGIFCKSDFEEHESFQVGRMLRALELDVTFTYTSWPGRIDDDSLYPNYCNSAGAARYVYEAEKSGIKINRKKFVELVTQIAIDFGGMPRFLIPNVQSSIMMATEQ